MIYRRQAEITLYREAKSSIPRRGTAEADATQLMPKTRPANIEEACNLRTVK